MGGLAPVTRRPVRARSAAAWLVCAALLAACSSVPEGGTIHVVRPGENLYRISKHYGVSVEMLVRANGIRDVTNVAVGQQLRIPGASRSQPMASVSPGAGARGGGQVDGAAALRESDLRFSWPANGHVNSKFGWRGRRRHEGIDIKADRGAPVRASEAGRVIYSGKLKDYGRVVVIKHAGRYSTVYAHNHRNRVKRGQFVEKGDQIADVGRTGNATGPHLHFEVRRDRVAHDPMHFLPKHPVTASR